MDLHDKNILVTGGTGFIGMPLCGRLAAAGAKVTVLTRTRRSSNPDGTSYIVRFSELRSPPPDIIINLAGAPIAQRWTPAAKALILKSRLDTTSAVIDFIKSSTKKPELLISGSAIGFYGTDQTTAFDENTPPNSYHAAFSRDLCSHWEDEAAKAERYGVRTVLLRTGAVLAKDGGMLEKFLPPFKAGIGGPMGDGSQWISWIDREDLIGLVLHAIALPSLTGPLNGTAPNPVPNRVFAKTLAAVLNRPCFLPIPGFVMRLLLGEMAEELILEGQKVVPSKAVESGYQFSYPTLQSSLKKISAS